MSTEYSTDLTGVPSVTRYRAVAPQFRLNIFRLVRLRGLLMVAVFLCLAVPGLPLVYFLSPVEYESSATLQFLAKTPRILFDDSQQELSSSFEKYLNTQTGLINSPAVLLRVLDQPEIKAIDRISKQTDPLRILQAHLTVRNQRNSELVYVSYRDSERAVAQSVLGTIIDQYILLATGHAKTSGSERLEQLQKIRTETQDELNKAHERLGALYKEMGAGFDSLGGQEVSDMVAWHQSLTQATADRSSYEARVRQYQIIAEDLSKLTQRYKESPEEPIYAFNVDALTAADPVVLDLRGKVLQSEQATGLLENRFQADAPQWKVQKEAYDSLSKSYLDSIRDARGRILQSLVEQNATNLQTAQHQIEDAKQRENEFHNYINDRNKQLIQATRQQIEIEDLKVRVADTQDRLKKVEQRIYAIDVESNAPASFQVASRASSPDSPLTGKRLQLMLLVVMGAAGVGGGIGVWRELADQRVRDAHDIEAMTHVQVLASVPDAKADGIKACRGEPLILGEQQDSLMADEVRRVLTRIVYPPEGAGEQRTCMVASPGREDGRTSLTCNLAIALGQANRRVLVVDMCSRAPRVESALGLEPAEGVGEFVLDGREMGILTRPTAYRNVSVIGPGFHGEALVSKLASRDLLQFFEQAEHEYDHVILDTPPVLLMSDARLLAPVMDAVLLVASADHTTLGMLGRCLQGLHEVGARVVGIVLNRASAVRHTPAREPEIPLEQA